MIKTDPLTELLDEAAAVLDEVLAGAGDVLDEVLAEAMDDWPDEAALRELEEIEKFLDGGGSYATK